MAKYIQLPKVQMLLSVTYLLLNNEAMDDLLSHHKLLFLQRLFSWRYFLSIQLLVEYHLIDSVSNHEMTTCGSSLLTCFSLKIMCGTNFCFVLEGKRNCWLKVQKKKKKKKKTLYFRDCLGPWMIFLVNITPLVPF